MNSPPPLSKTTTSLIANHLRFAVERRLLIDEVSVELNCGELVAIIGPNGAGKSTLLRLLTGYLQPHRGYCALLGKNYQQWDPLQLAQRRAVMCQHSRLVFPFSVKEVVGMGRLIHASSPHNQQAIETALAQTESSHLAKRNYCSLSGGEQQRVQLSRALAQLWQPNPQPRWLLLDEPTSALDLYHQQQTLRVLKKLIQTESLSVCCILHDINLAAVYADRILLLHQGRLVEQGPPQQVLTEQVLSRWYQADITVYPHPYYDHPQVFLRQ